MKKVTLLILSIITGLVVISTGIAQYLKEKSDKAELDDKDAEIKKLLSQQNSSLNEANKKLIDANKLQTRVIDAQEELLKSNEKISLLNEEIKNNVIGGDSHPIISLFFEPYGDYRGLDTNFITAKFKIINKGKYPIKSLKVTISDYVSGIDKIITKEGPGSYKVNIDHSYAENDFKKIFQIETLSLSAGYQDLYKGRILRTLETFSYLIDIQWLKGHMHYTIQGEIDQKTNRIKVTSIFPLSEYANPFEFLEIYPQFVGENLQKFDNPLQ